MQLQQQQQKAEVNSLINFFLFLLRFNQYDRTFENLANTKQKFDEINNNTI
jgi:hypothetical protein